MTQFLQALVNGVSLAGIYALVALGFVIIYKSMQVLNFAQPALLLLGGYWVLYFATIWGWPFGIAILVGAVLAALTGVIVERTTLRPMVGKPVFAVAIPHDRPEHRDHRHRPRPHGRRDQADG
jgi:branched-chain amino acid transport system permease protein